MGTPGAGQTGVGWSVALAGVQADEVIQWVQLILQPADIETPPTRQTTQHLEMLRQTHAALQPVDFPSAILPTAMVFCGASTSLAVLVDDFLCFVFSSLGFPWSIVCRVKNSSEGRKRTADRHHLTRTARSFFCLSPTMSTKLRLRSREEHSQKPLRIRAKGGGSGRTIYLTWRRRPYGVY